MMSERVLLRVEGRRSVFQCSSCKTAEVAVVNRATLLKKEPLCTVCSGKRCASRPFEALFNRLVRTAAPVSLTYEEYLSLFVNRNCHYCDRVLRWVPFNLTIEYRHHLSRKNLKMGYTVDNSIVCCTDCRNLRGDRFNYEEMLMFVPVLRKIHLLRTKSGVL